MVKVRINLYPSRISYSVFLTNEMSHAVEPCGAIESPNSEGFLKRGSIVSFRKNVDLY